MRARADLRNVLEKLPAIDELLTDAARQTPEREAASRRAAVEMNIAFAELAIRERQKLAVDFEAQFNLPDPTKTETALRAHNEHARQSGRASHSRRPKVLEGALDRVAAMPVQNKERWRALHTALDNANACPDWEDGETLAQSCISYDSDDGSRGKISYGAFRKAMTNKTKKPAP